MVNVLKNVSNSINAGLETAFYRLGVFVGTYPRRVLAGTTFVCALFLLGLMRFQQESRLEKLWVPQDSDVIRNQDFVKQNYPAVFEQGIMVAVKLPSGGDAGALEAANIKQLYQIHTEILNSLTVYDGRNWTWDELAYRRSSSGNPWISSILALWEFDGNVINNLTTDDILAKVNEPNTLMDPWNGGVFELNSSLGGIRFSGPNSTMIVSAEAARTFHRIIANYSFDSGSGEEVDARFEDWAKKFHSIGLRGWSMFREVTVFSQFGLSEEAGKAIQGDIQLLSAGYILILAYVILNLGRYNRLQHKVWLSISGIISTGLAIGVSFGLCSAFGLFYGPVHSVLPFLLLGIGVDDMFVIVQVWSEMSNEEHTTHTVPERLGICLKRAGVSVTVTSITDLVAFLIGAATILPALRSFCIYAGIGVLFDFLLQVTFFAATVALDAERIDQRRDACLFCMRLSDDWRPFSIEGRWLYRYFKNYHVKMLRKMPVKIGVLLSTLIVGAFSIYAATQIEIFFDFFSFLPSGSYILDYDRVSDKYFADGRVRFDVYVGNVDYTSPSTQGKLDILLNNTRSDPYVSTSIGVESWFEGLRTFNDTNVTGSNFYPSLNNYLAGPGARFGSKLNYSGTASPPALLASSFQATLVKLVNTQDNIKALDSVTAAAAQTFDNGQRSFAYSRFFLGWTTDKVIDQELVRNLLLAMAAVCIVTLLLIANIVSSLCVLTCVILTVVDAVMVMHYWDVTINTVSSVVLILSVGLAVDYSAHIAHFFMTCHLKTRQERVDASLTNVGVAVFSGGFSTFLAFVLLALSSSYVFTVFFRVNLAVVIFGLWHGLVFLPTVLSLIGPASHAELKIADIGGKGDAELDTVKKPAGENGLPVGSSDPAEPKSLPSPTSLTRPKTPAWAESLGGPGDDGDERTPQLV